MSTLYIVATPIGNLGDISQRALDTLREVDVILSEDTRETKKLLNRFQIATETISYHQHSRLTKVKKILNLLESGSNLALVSDAGTPGLSDPGNKLVAAVANNLADRVKIVPIPGPSALTTAVSIAGFPMDRFLFLGFPPQKKKRNKFFKQVIDSSHPVIFYESPHRILKTLKELADAIQTSNISAKICLGRELTKHFETIYRGVIGDVIKELEKEDIRGEFVLILNKE